MLHTQAQPDAGQQTHIQKTYSVVDNPLVAGNPGEDILSPDEVLEVICILKDAGVNCCIVQIFALMYYGAPRVSSDRVLCVPNEDYERAVELFKTRTELLEPCGPLPLRTPTSLNHKYPRFKVKGRVSFWQLVPESYAHFECKPENIEWSSGGIPYPKLHLYVQRAIDIKDGVELEDLIDGMDLSEKWGEENLNLDGTTDTEWLEEYYQAVQADSSERGLPERAVSLKSKPTPRRQIWERSVRNKQRRLGWKYSPEIYATSYRKHGSPDPRTRDRPGL